MLHARTRIHTSMRQGTHKHACKCGHVRTGTHTHRPISNTYCFSTAPIIRERACVTLYLHIICLVSSSLFPSVLQKCDCDAFHFWMSSTHFTVGMTVKTPRLRSYVVEDWQRIQSGWRKEKFTKTNSCIVVLIKTSAIFILLRRLKTIRFKIAFTKKLDWNQGMLAIILCRIFCRPVCYPKV